MPALLPCVSTTVASVRRQPRHGRGEVDDAQAAPPGCGPTPGLPLTLFGFSFGGFVAASLGGRLEAQGRVQAAVHGRAGGDAPGRSGSAATAGELTVIQPETDEVIDPQLVYDWSEALSRPHELLKVAECGHFFMAS
jgi:alpha/beta superfamily hydrolase